MALLIDRIVCGVDFSHASHQALQYAVEWAKACEAQLHLVHVIPMDPHFDLEAAVVRAFLDEQRQSAQLQLMALSDQLKSDVPEIAAHLAHGTPADELARLACQEGGDLLVVGSHGWTGFDRILLGSTAERVLASAPCPVLTVRRPDTNEQASLQLGRRLPRHILVPVDFSDHSQEAVEYASEMAKQFDIAVTLLHVVEPVSYSLDFTLTHVDAQKKKTKLAETRLAELARVFESRGMSASYQLKSPPVVQAILEGVQESKADVIVMGTHGRRGMARWLLGSMAASVLRQAPVPVLTVRSPRFSQEHPRKTLHSSRENANKVT
ncbi:MAG: universal stress protein [Nitrospirae bacterium]|nr:MAG: universal stress protein [Nitrospirota bacterium]